MEYTNLIGGFAPIDLSDSAAAEYVRLGICSTLIKPEEQAMVDLASPIVEPHKNGKLKLVKFKAAGELMHRWQEVDGLMLGEITATPSKRTK